MIISRLYGFGSSDDGYQSLPSSDLLNQPDPNAAPRIDSTGAMYFPPMVITGSASTYGTGPVSLPITAPVPLTEDEIAEAYGGNPITKVFQAGLTTTQILGGAVALAAVGLMIYSGRSGGRRRGRRRRRR